METRKAQLTGGSTFTVSLPKEWATDIELETGDTFHLFPRGSTLIIQPADETGDRWEANVRIDNFSEAEVRRTVQALYTAGFDRITLSAPTNLEDHRRVVSAAARKLIGLEILESTDTHITLQGLLDPATVSVAQSTIQLEQVALAMHEDAITALLEQDDDLIEHVIERDNQVDRLYGMVSRHFQRSLVSLRETEELDLDQSTIYDHQTTARQLERVGDHAEKIAAVAARFDNPPGTFDDEIEASARRSREIVKQATSTVIRDTDIDTAYDVLDKRDDLTADLENLERELHEQDVPESHLIALTIDSVTRTAEYGGNIAESALQAAARNRQL